MPLIALMIIWRMTVQCILLIDRDLTITEVRPNNDENYDTTVQPGK